MYDLRFVPFSLDGPFVKHIIEIVYCVFAESRLVIKIANENQTVKVIKLIHEVFRKFPV